MKSSSEFRNKFTGLVDLQEEMAKKFAGVMLASADRVPEDLSLVILKTFGQYQDVVGDLLTLFLTELQEIRREVKWD